MSIADRIAASAGIMLRAMGQAGQALGQSAPGQPLGGGSLTGGSLPDLGIHGDLVAAAEMFRRVREQDDINQGGYSGSGGMFGMYPWISEYRARGIIPLTSGLRLISGVVMQMPLRQFRGDLEVIPPAPVVQNPAPADNGTLASYIDGYVSDISLYGNHLSILGEPDSTAWPASVLPVDITRVSVARSDSGQLLYHYADTDDDAILTASEVLHVALDRRSGEMVGRGLIPTMAAALQATTAAEEYAARYFDESAIPTGVIQDSRPDLTQAQATDLKSQWMATVGGRRRVPIVLPQSTIFTPLVSDADNAQLIQARQWNSQTVAMALGIPPFMLGIETQRHTYTNAENEFGRFVRTTIQRLLVPLEQQLSLMCLPRGNTAVFDERQLLRPEMAARFTMAIQGFASHLLTEGEARELMGYPADGGPGIGPSDTGGIELDPTQQPPQLALLPAPAPATPAPAVAAEGADSGG